MRKILVTGASGLLGTTLVPYLKGCGYRVLSQSRIGVSDFCVDLSDCASTDELLRQVQPGLIINLAGLTSVEQCQEQTNAAYSANTCTVENLVNSLIKREISCHLIQISTDQVYDGTGPHMEDAVTITNNYAFSKYAGELSALRIPSTILRTNFVGRSQARGRESITDWVYSAMSAHKQVSVVNDVLFSPLSMATLSVMIQLVIEKRPSGVFNLGSKEGMSKADFDFAFAESLGLSTTTMKRVDSNEAIFFKAYRPKDMRMNCSKFENTFGVKLPYLNDEIKSVAKEYHDAN